MFGIYRYSLAFCVAISHLWGGMIAGPAAYAVWGFYCLSGYLMTLILSEEGGRAGARAARRRRRERRAGPAGRAVPRPDRQAVRPVPARGRAPRPAASTRADLSRSSQRFARVRVKRRVKKRKKILTRSTVSRLAA